MTARRESQPTSICKCSLDFPQIALLLSVTSVVAFGAVEVGAQSATAVNAAPCAFTSGEATDELIVIADVLYPLEPATSKRPPVFGVGIDYAVYMKRDETGKGVIGDVDEVDAILDAYDRPSVLDCRGKAVLSPGLVNSHEHPSLSYRYPDPNRVLPNDYSHRYEWRHSRRPHFVPDSVTYEWTPEGNLPNFDVFLSVEVRHVLGGATLLAGYGGVPGLAKNVVSVYSGKLHNFSAAQALLVTDPFKIEVNGGSENLESWAGYTHAQTQSNPKLNVKYYPYSDPHVPHAGEGTNTLAQREIDTFIKYAQGKPSVRFAFIHAVPADEEQFKQMANRGIALIWSPRSNLALYGQTAAVDVAVANGVTIALGTDWSQTGSFNMQQEFECARRIQPDLSSQSLWQMATYNAAYALGMEDEVGSILDELASDLILVRKAENRSGDPFEAVVTASQDDLLATWIDGRVVLVSTAMPGEMRLGNCLELQGVTPLLCGVFENQEDADDFLANTADIVPLIDTRNQASCTVN